MLLLSCRGPLFLGCSRPLFLCCRNLLCLSCSSPLNHSCHWLLCHSGLQLLYFSSLLFPWLYWTLVLHSSCQITVLYSSQTLVLHASHLLALLSGSPHQSWCLVDLQCSPAYVTALQSSPAYVAGLQVILQSGSAHLTDFLSILQRDSALEDGRPPGRVPLPCSSPCLWFCSLARMLFHSWILFCALASHA